MSHKEYRGLKSWLGLVAVAGLLALSLVLVSGLVAADEEAPAEWPPWKQGAILGGVDTQGASPLSPSELGAWDGFRVDWPCVMTDSLGYAMLYSGFNPNGPGFGWQIGGATSPDGTTWTKDAGNPLVGLGAPGEWDELFRGQVSCLNDGGTRKMWFSGASDGPWQSGYATSTDGTTWNLYGGNPVLPPGGTGSWDEVEAAWPMVIKDGGTYEMWYMGCDAGYNTCSIGYATSPDGMAWTKYSGNPVLTGTPGEWDEDYVWGPWVIKNGGAYQMWYNGGDEEIGYATSTDGIDWNKHPENPILSQGWDGAGVERASVLLEGSTYKMWVRSGAGTSRGIGYATSSDGIAWTMYGGNPVLTTGAPGLLANVNYDHEWVEVQAQPDVTVVISVADGGGTLKATVTGQTNQTGWFPTYEGTWDPEQPDIAPGDIVTATSDLASTEVNPVGTIDAEVDLDNDIVSGILHAPWFAPQTLAVSCEAWVENGPAIQVPDVAADGGSFTCDFGAIGWDLTGGDDVAVRYMEPDGDSVIAVPLPLQPFLTVDYEDDWVDGQYEAGHTVWITVTESDRATVKATAEVESQVYPEWGGWTGFTTFDEDWVPAKPDILPGDWAEVMVDNGYGNEVRVGLIDGESNVDTDVVQGTIHAAWLLQETVRVNCEIHEENAPGIQIEGVNPDGGSFYCDFGGEWDILPGHNVVVNYQELDSDRVQTHFIEPTANMRVEKWAEGSGEAAPGGGVVYGIRYRNEGEAEAATILLTDTLPAGTTYVSDSSGQTPAVGGGLVVWALGPLDPEQEGLFYLVLSNTASPDDTLTNQVDIHTDGDFDEGNNHAEADVHVSDEQPDLYVDKNRASDEPAPGETMLYQINYGNNGPVSSGPVVMTDTLPSDTSVVTWWSENGYDLWEEQSRNGELVLTVPSIPGNWGDQLYIRVEVDAGVPLDTELFNEVDIYTAGDSNPSDNHSERSDWTREPHRNGAIFKEFGWGTTVPGGEGEYWLNPRNEGNIAASVRVTETLPTGTSFLHARRWTGSVEVPFPPTYVDDEVAVWDLGVMEPGEWINLNVRLGYDADLLPGKVLDNCAVVATVGEDQWPYDDQSCAEVQINELGSNVSVNKRANWNGEEQLEYRIRVVNNGTTTLQDVVITDNLPAGTSFTGNWWHNFWEDIQFNQVGDQLNWTVSRLEPTWSFEIGFQADLDGGLIGVQGLAFTNTVEAPVTGDVYPTDNLHELVSYTGPDLFAEKWLSEGRLVPGERVTFTVRSGNQSPWPWRVDESATVRLTERLPDGMSYVGAWWPDGNPNDPWFYDPATGVVVWDFGSMGGEEWRVFDLVVDLDPGLSLGDVLVNQLEVNEVPPELDVDPVPDNNLFDLSLLVGWRIYVPLVSKP